MTITSQFSISMKLLPPLYISHALDDLISNCCWNRPWLVKYSQQPKSLVWCPPFSKHGTRYIFGNLTEHTGADRKWFFLQRWFVKNARRRGSWERWSTRTPGKLAAPTTQLQGRRGEVERWNQSIFIIGIGNQFWVSCKNRWVKTSCWLRGKIASTLLTRTSKSAEFASRRYSMCSQFHVPGAPGELSLLPGVRVRLVHLFFLRFAENCLPSGAPGELALLPRVRLQEGDLRHVRPQDHWHEQISTILCVIILLNIARSHSNLWRDSR